MAVTILRRSQVETWLKLALQRSGREKNGGLPSHELLLCRDWLSLLDQLAQAEDELVRLRK